MRRPTLLRGWAACRTTRPSSSAIPWPSSTCFRTTTRTTSRASATMLCGACSARASSRVKGRNGCVSAGSPNRPSRPAPSRPTTRSWSRPSQPSWTDGRPVRGPAPRWRSQREMARLTLRIVARTLFGVDLGKWEDRILDAISELFPFDPMSRGPFLGRVYRYVPLFGKIRKRLALSKFERSLSWILANCFGSEPHLEPDHGIDRGR